MTAVIAAVRSMVVTKLVMMLSSELISGKDVYKHYRTGL